MLRLQWRNDQRECPTCKKDATVRELCVAIPGLSGKNVAYLSHAGCLTDDAHHAAIKRLHAFYLKLGNLVIECNARAKSDGLVFIKDIDFGSVMPSACEVRTQIIPVVTIRAFSLEEDLRLPARSLDTQKVDALIEEIKEQSEPIKEKFKGRFANGQF